MNRGKAMAVLAAVCAVSAGPEAGAVGTGPRKSDLDLALGAIFFRPA